MAKLRPLWTPGGSRSSARDPSAPSMVSGVLSNMATHLEDFMNCNIAASGTPSWLLSNVAGTGTARSGGVAVGVGAIIVTTTTASNDCSIVSSAATAGQLGTYCGLTSWNLVIRPVLTATNTSCRQGFAFVRNDTVVVGTNFLNAPATALAGAAYMAIVRDTGVTPAGGAAGDWCLYVEDSATVPQSLGLGAATGSTANKFELAFRTDGGGGGTITAYKNGAVIGALVMVDTSTLAFLRFDFGVQTLTTAARSLQMDCIYYENELATAR